MHENGNVFTGVVRPGPGRVVAVVGRDDEKVPWVQDIQQFRQAAVEFLEGAAVARDIAAVSVEGIEVDEVGHHDAAITGAFQGREGFPPEGGVSTGPHFFRQAGVGIDIANFTNPDHRAALLAKTLQDSG